MTVCACAHPPAPEDQPRGQTSDCMILVVAAVIVRLDALQLEFYDGGVNRMPVRILLIGDRECCPHHTTYAYTSYPTHTPIPHTRS